MTKRLEDVIQKILTTAIIGVSPRRVGALIERLSSEDRELLKSATAKDFNHRVK